ncbi:MAG: GC-type dockerin domain-anchored protein, partial [Phycisphaerales bacterium JB059]
VPRAQIQRGYALGMPIDEAAFRSLHFYPFQPVIYGDPLARPFAHIPQVTVPDAPTGPVSGPLTLTPQATTTHPSATIESLELLIDGVSVGAITPGQSFHVNTLLLDEGSHDIRVLAYDSTSIRTVGRWVDRIDVDNTPHAATLSVDTTSANLVHPFQFTINASGAPIRELRLFHNGRVVAAGTTTDPLTVHGQMLGAGPALVEGQAEFTDGTIAWTTPIQLDIEPTGAPFTTVPTVYSHTKTVSPLAPFVVELPATHSEQIDRPNWAVTNPPDQATMLNDSGPYRIFQPDPDASGTDTLEFRVFTPTAQSVIVPVTIIYQIPPACPADIAEPFNVLDFTDVIAFLGAFGAAEPEADLAPPFTVFDFSDILEFLAFFADGCAD